MDYHQVTPISDK